MKKFFALLIVLSMVLVASAAFAGNAQEYICSTPRDTGEIFCAKSHSRAILRAGTKFCRSVQDKQKYKRCITVETMCALVPGTTCNAY